MNNLIDKNNKLSLYIAGVNQKLKLLFPMDPRTDVLLTFKTKTYRLQKAHLRIYSQFFKKECLNQLNQIQIKQNFNEQDFQKVLSMLYGNTIQIDRNQIGNFYPICQFLKLQFVSNLIKKDIIQNFLNYSIYAIFKIAYQQNDQKLFDLCIQNLQRQNFQQFKYEKYELFTCNICLFKLMLKIQRKYRTETFQDLNCLQTDQMLKQYCSINGFGESQYNQLKFQVFDINDLNSKEYKQIFLDQVNKTSKNQQIKMDIVSSGQNVSNQLRLRMQNTFERKKNTEQKKQNEQLKDQNEYLKNQLLNLKILTNHNQDVHKQMQSQIKNLKTIIQNKQKKNNCLQKFEVLLEDIQKKLEKKTQEIQILYQKFDEKMNKQPIGTTSLIKSQFLPADLVHEIMYENINKGFKQSSSQIFQQQNLKNKKKLSKQLQRSQNCKQNGQQKYLFYSFDQNELEDLYKDMLQFESQPVTLQKTQIAILSLFLHKFNKNRLNLIYRRSHRSSKVGEKQVLYNRKHLLVLIRNQFNIQIGGYISQPLIQNGYINDKNAFIFTLKNNKKFNISAQKAQQAISMSQKYLLSFSSDLTISNECLIEKSHCQWPKSYNIPHFFNSSSKNLTQKFEEFSNQVWFAGAKDFLISDLQIYQINKNENQ